MAKISKERKAAYYVGMGMMIVGFLLFFSVFFSGFTNDPFSGNVPSFQNAPIGMLLLIAGSIVMGIGAKGKAGSGLVLDPEKAREDLRPFSEAAGGIIHDAIGNIDAIHSNEAKEVIKIRCRNCHALNEEDAKFCKACGKEL